MPLLAGPHYYYAKFMAVRCNQTCPSVPLRALLINLTRAWGKLKKKSAWCAGGHWFDSCRGLRFFLCLTLVSC